MDLFIELISEVCGTAFANGSVLQLLFFIFFLLGLILSVVGIVRGKV